MTDPTKRQAGRIRFDVDCSGCRSRQDVLAALAAGLALPEWFGMNLDALFDALVSLPESRPAKGYTIVLRELPGRSSAFGDKERKGLLAVFEEASAELAKRKISLDVQCSFRDGAG